ncbi:hypothetical protein KUTeg_009004 [Tegillarca granosa]|uniref:DUF3730 domain-containing protein n=1 Tax=Tegillarca granosa TaxID=220873 RepID=A0ABQ9F7U7_TEGGR|nr:hypothetical protein KUTeg_009004 [Tegillarca granosa]
MYYRSPPHPFITVLTNRPESWQLLQQQINNFCFHGNQSVRQSSLQILGPFIEFSLLEPQQSVQYQPMRFGLQRLLLHVARESEDPEVTRNVIKFLIKVIPLFQIQNSDNLGFTCQFLVEILHLLAPKSDDYESELQFLAEYSLTLSEECVHSNHIDMKSLTDALLNVLKSSPKVLSADRNMVTIANLLLIAPLDDIGSLLQCVKYILKVDNININATVIAMVILPLLQILALPRTTGLGKTLQILQALAAEVMTLVERQITMTLTSEKEKKNNDSIKEFVTCLTASSYTSQTIVRLSQEFTKSPQQTKKWLQNLPSILSNVKHVPSSITNMVAALLVVSRDSDQSNLALQSLVKIATQDVNQAPYFLPLLLYKLGRDGDPEQRLMIMKSIPAMARHKVCVAPILKTIQMLGSSPKLKAVSINLLTDLWKLQERCYPQLLKAITENVSMVTKTGGLDEILLAKATAIREVCKSRPEQHGADLLGPLSDILNSAISESDAPIAALVLEGLYYLCEAEARHMVLWNLVLLIHLHVHFMDKLIKLHN